MELLKIENLHVSIEDKAILKGVNLTINEGENHALLGPNGNGKSTLLKVLMGHPAYTVTKGKITFKGKDLMDMEIDERSKAGIFLAQQHPSEVPGIKNSEFLKVALDAHSEKPNSVIDFRKKLEASSKDLKINPDQNERYLNVGFSGGEKKKNEILQLKLLNPNLALVDEIDSGLDVDALQVVAKVLQEQLKSGMALLTVSHYERLYSLIKPTHAHIIIDGKIVKSGGYEVIEKIDTDGFEWVKPGASLDMGGL